MRVLDVQARCGERGEERGPEVFRKQAHSCACLIMSEAASIVHTLGFRDGRCRKALQSHGVSGWRKVP